MSLDDMDETHAPLDAHNAPPPLDVGEQLIAPLDAHSAALRDLALAIARGLHEVALAIRQR